MDGTLMAAPARAGSALGVSMRGLRKSYGATEVIRNFDLDIAPGELVTLLGPSGSGKTMILNMLAGFTDATDGTILIGDRDVTHLPPETRNIGMVFQNFALFPNLSVIDNVAFPLRMRRVGKAERRRRALETLEKVQLGAFAKRRPNELSGGQKQRVAIARALVFDPPVLLMDECLSSLDLKLREQLQVEIRRLHRDIGATILFVTHDQGEAMSLSDRIAVMRDGALVQVGAPRDIYDRPADDFIATFIGKTNFFARTAGRIEGMEVPMPGPDARLSVRPNLIRRIAPGQDGEIAFSGTVVDTAFTGTITEYLLRTDWGQEVTVQEPAEVPDSLSPGDRAEFGFAARHAYPLPTGRTAHTSGG